MGTSKAGGTLNADLGSTATLSDLLEQVRGFDYEYATTPELHALAGALKIIATDVVRQHDEVTKLRADLTERCAAARVVGELSGVLDIINPKPRWFQRRNPRR